MLSIQAAYTAPMTEYQISAQAVLEVKLLHQKLDELREVEFEEVKSSLRQVQQLLRRSEEREQKSVGYEQPQGRSHQTG